MSQTVAADPQHLPGVSAVQRPTLTVRGQHQLCTLSRTSGDQPGITGKRPASKIPNARPVEAPHQRHDQRLLTHVTPGDGPTDDHARDLRRALENQKACGRARSFRRLMASWPVACQHQLGTTQSGAFAATARIISVVRFRRSERGVFPAPGEEQGTPHVPGTHAVGATPFPLGQPRRVDPDVTPAAECSARWLERDEVGLAQGD
jgi:hypothetical protein